MKQLKPQECYSCTWCAKADVKTKAVWREGRMGIRRYACSEHRQDLFQFERRPERITEADEQTWMRL